jgi:hypothetical protein
MEEDVCRDVCHPIPAHLRDLHSLIAQVQQHDPSDERQQSVSAARLAANGTSTCTTTAMAAGPYYSDAQRQAWGLACAKDFVDGHFGWGCANAAYHAISELINPSSGMRRSSLVRTISTDRRDVPQPRWSSSKGLGSGSDAERACWFGSHRRAQTAFISDDDVVAIPEVSLCSVA